MPDHERHLLMTWQAFEAGAELSSVILHVSKMTKRCTRKVRDPYIRLPTPVWSYGTGVGR